jgi:fructose-1-phosphate kinase PfkB-like protein
MCPQGYVITEITAELLLNNGVKVDVGGNIEGFTKAETEENTTIPDLHLDSIENIKEDTRIDTNVRNNDENWIGDLDNNGPNSNDHQTDQNINNTNLKDELTEDNATDESITTTYVILY